MSDWHFVRPLWLLALLGVPVLAWLYTHRRHAGGRWRQFVDPQLLPYVLTSHAGSTTRGAWPWLFSLLASLLIVALAGPVRERLPQPVYQDEAALIIGLDLSRSMNAQDVLPSRLARARLKIRDILESRTEGDTALIAFAGDAFTVTPLTDDGETIAALLNSLTTNIMPRQGSMLAPMLERAERLLTQADAPSGRVLILTDGVADQARAQTAARRLAQKGVSVSILALGTAQGDVVRGADGELVKDRDGQIIVARTDIAALAAVSAAGDGRIIGLTPDSTDIDTLLGAGAASLPNGRLSDGLKADVWHEEGPLLVLLCLPFVALIFRRGWVACIAALAFMPPPAAHAGLWNDLWERRDQQAAAAFSEQEFATAQQLFADPQWRAAAAYRDGDYVKSASELAGIDLPQAHYNRGNALAMAGSIDAARAAYKAALDLQPDHEDARYNLDLLDQLQQQQQQQSQDDSNESEQDEQDGEQQQKSESGQDSQQQDKEQQDASQSESDEQPSEQQQAQDESQEGDEQGENEQQQAQESDDEQSQEEQEAKMAQMEQEQGEQERDLAAEQWLRQVPDDPGGLLRRKFLRQYRDRYRDVPAETEEW